MNKKKNTLNNIGTFLLFAGPATLAFLAVVIIPFLYGFYLTFTSWDGVSKSKETLINSMFNAPIVLF